MKNWVTIIISLLVLGVTLFLLGDKALNILNWFTAIIGVVVGTAALFCAGIHWGKFLGNTL